MGISSPRPYGNTSPGGATSPTLSCHSTLSRRQRSQIYREETPFPAAPGCSRPAAAPAVTIIGPAWVEKASLVIESSPPSKKKIR